MVTTQKHVKGLYKLISVCNLDICALYNYFVTIHFHFVGLKRKKLGNLIAKIEKLSINLRLINTQPFQATLFV